MIQGSHILVIDDERGIREMLSYDLRHSGQWVATASNALEGLERLKDRRFDLVLLDIMMPGMSGIDALKAIKQNCPDTTVIMMTGHATVETAVASLKAGAADYIQKPFELEELEMMITRELERKKLSALVAMYQAGLAALETRDYQTLLPKIVQLAMQALRADDASLMINDKSSHLMLACSYDAKNSKLSIERKEIAFDGVAARVAQLKKPVLLPNGLSNDSRFSDLDTSKRVKSSIVYPLLKGDRLLGVLNINRVAKDEPFGDEDLQRATVLASMITLSIENAQLFSELEERITELTSTQQKLIHSEKMAAFGQLAAGVAHEINNPSAFICTNLTQLNQHCEAMTRFIQKALAGADHEQLKTLAQEIDMATILGQAKDIVKETSSGFSRIVDIVHDPRSFARIGDRKMRPFALASSVETALRMAKNEIQLRSQLNTTIDPSIHVVGNQGQLSQVFLNLLINAAQAMPQGQYHENRIEVLMRGAAHWAEVTVGDTGSGIKPDDLARIFTPFFTTKGNEQGTGLGLAVSEEIIRKHGGSIEVQTTLGHGTQFTVRLPLAEEQPLELESEESRLDPAEVKTSRILLIDDEPSLLRSIKRIIGSRHDVLLAENGEDALVLIGQHRAIHAVICDLLMPGLTGMEVYRKACELNPALKDRFIFMTGDAYTVSAKEFADRFKDWILTKPFHVEDLERLLQKRISTRMSTPSC